MSAKLFKFKAALNHPRNKNKVKGMKRICQWIFPKAKVISPTWSALIFPL